MPRALLAVVLALVACEAPQMVRVDPPWAADQWVVLVEVDEAGAARPASIRVLEPGEAVNVPVEPDQLVRLQAAAWTTSLRGCTFRSGGGDLPTMPAGGWSATLSADGLSTSWQPSTAPLPLHTDCSLTQRTCSDITFTRIDVGGTYGGLGAVHAFKLEALAGGVKRSPTSTVTEMMQIDRGGRALDLSLPEFRDDIAGIADVGDDIVAATVRGDLMRLRPTHEYLRRIPGGIRHITSSGDGVLLIQRSSTTTPEFLEMRFPSGEITERVDIPNAMRAGRAIERDLEYFLSEDGVVVRGNRAGHFVREISVGAVAEPLDVLGTSTVAFVLARYSGPFRRGPDGVWADMGKPVNFPTPRALGLLSRDRVIIASFAGNIGVWEAGEWCLFQSDRRDRINALDVASDGRTVWMVGGNEDHFLPPAVLRLVLPP